MKIGNMLTTCLPAGICGLFAFSAAGGATQAAGLNDGEAEFRENCAACHIDGGNIIDPGKTLSKTDREKHGIKTAKDIIKIMRKPGERMIMFDEIALPEQKAEKIADYIIKTFK